jgi:hypothetical protein
LHFFQPARACHRASPTQYLVFVDDQRLARNTGSVAREDRAAVNEEALFGSFVVRHDDTFLFGERVAVSLRLDVALSVVAGQVPQRLAESRHCLQSGSEVNLPPRHPNRV